MARPERNGDAASPRVLVVEDEGIVAADIRLTLRDLGYTVIDTVASAEKAIDIAQRARPDLILMDIVTKGPIDGVQAAKVIRERCAIPVVFLTAHADPETVQRARSAEPLGYVVKPFKDIDLRTAIEIALQRHQTEEQLRERERLLALETERLATLIANLSTGVMLEDERGEIRHANGQLLHLLDDDRSRMALVELPIGVALDELSTRFEDRVLSRDIMGALADARAQRRSPLLRSRSGRQIEIDYVPIFSAGVYGGALWTLSDVTEREQARSMLRLQAERMRELATTDELTGLLNRRGLLTLAPLQHQIALRERRCLVAGYIDLNGMKSVNDTLGHSAGDELLRAAAEVLRRTFRSSDVIARVGGDEFAVFAMVAASGDVRVLGERLHANLQQANQSRGARPALSFSVGFAIADPGLHDDVEALLARADAAMYEQKREQRRASSPA